MRNQILNYLPDNFNKLCFSDKRKVIILAKTEILKSRSNLNTLIKN